MYRENFERDLFILSIKVNASNQILYSPDDLSMDIISDSTNNIADKVSLDNSIEYEPMNWNTPNSW